MKLLPLSLGLARLLSPVSAALAQTVNIDVNSQKSMLSAVVFGDGVYCAT